MDMDNVIVTIKDAAVTAVHEFRSFKGYGVDFYIEAMSGNSPVYFQVVFYDDIARSYCRNIHEGDHVKVTGSFRDKIYRKKDGTDGHISLMERPKVFAKTACSNSEQQVQPSTANEKAISDTQYQDDPGEQPSYFDSDEFWAEVEKAKAASAATAENADAADKDDQKNNRPTVNSDPKLKTFIIDGQKFEAYENDDTDDFDSPF